MDKKKNIIILVVTSIIFILLLILFIVSINKGKETINELKPNNDANIKSASKATVNNEVSNKANDKDEDENITRQDNNDSSVDIKNENDVIQYFENNYSDINSNKVSIKDKAKEYFIDIVDFIFYDKEIKGYTFSELSDNTKIKVIALALKIDSKIEEYIPGYKKSISSKGNKIYTDVKDRLVSSYLDLSVKICSNNEEGCNKAKDIFSDIKIELIAMLIILLTMIIFEKIRPFKDTKLDDIFEVIVLIIIYLSIAQETITFNYIVSALYLFYGIIKKTDIFVTLGIVLILLSTLINLIQAFSTLATIFVILVIGISLIGYVLYKETKKNKN